MKAIERLCKGIHALFVIVLLHWFVRWLIPVARYGDLNTSEWASWVQAIGSILAIVAAFLVGERQHTAGRKLEIERRSNDHIRRLKVILALLSKTRVTASHVGKAFESDKLGDLPDNTINYLHDCSTALDRLPVFEIPDSRLVVIIAGITRALPEMYATFTQARIEADSQGLREFPAIDTFERQINDVLDLVNKGTQICVMEISRMQPISSPSR